MIKCFGIIISIGMIVYSGYAQFSSGSISNQGGLVSFYNPALHDSEDGLNIWFSEIQSSVYNSAFVIDDVIYSSGNSNVVNFQAITDKLSASNRGFVDASFQTLGISWRKGKQSFGLGHRIRYVSDVSYSEELIRLVSFGNANFIGQELDIGPGFTYAHYHEVYLSGSFEMERFSVGARIKLLAGNEYMGADKERINLTTQEDYYALQFSNDYSIVTSGIFTYNGLDNISLDFDPYRFQKFFSGNSGIAIDLGVTMDIGASGKLMASYQDLGSINWDINTSKYESKGEFVYDGVNILDYVADDGNVEIADSLYDLLQFHEIEDVEFSYSIPSQWTLGYKSMLNGSDIFMVGIMGKRIKSRNTLTGVLGYNKKFSGHLSASVTYTITGKSYDNIGATAFLNFNTFNFYLGVENVLNMINLLGTRYGGFHLGMNFNI